MIEMRDQLIQSLISSQMIDFSDKLRASKPGDQSEPTHVTRQILAGETRPGCERLSEVVDNRSLWWVGPPIPTDTVLLRQAAAVQEGVNVDEAKSAVAGYRPVVTRQNGSAGGRTAGRPLGRGAALSDAAATT